MHLKKAVLWLVLLSPCATVLQAQTVDDGVMMSKRSLCTGVLYANDQWHEYWEGALKRTNGNIGTITTQSVTWMGTYGVTDRLNVIAMLPYVRTEASQGVLHGMSGLQDFTIAAKYRLAQKSLAHGDALRVFVVATAGAPASNYTPDFLPLSIGTSSARSAGRATLHYQRAQGWFVGATAAYTVRGQVTLDRSFYFTDGTPVLSNRVAMPDVFDYSVSLGFRNARLHIPLSFSQQKTQGGGDIRRQDAPFVSNRMNYSRVDGAVTYSLPVPRNLAVKLAAGRVLNGRNVGQSTTLTGGLLYTFHF